MRWPSWTAEVKNIRPTVTRSMPRLWSQSAVKDTSRTLFDPWSFGHAFVGVAQFCITARLLSPPFGVGLLCNTAIHCVWEVVENAPAAVRLRAVCNRIETGYAGDAIINSIGDVVCFVIGYSASWWLSQRAAWLPIVWGGALLCAQLSFWPGMPLSPETSEEQRAYLRNMRDALLCRRGEVQEES